MKLKKKILISVLSISIVLIVVVVACNLAVIYNSSGRVIDKADDVSDCEIPNESSKVVSIFGVTTNYNESVLLHALAEANIIKIDTLISSSWGFEHGVIEFADVKFGANKDFVFITSQQTRQAITSLVEEISKYYGKPHVDEDYTEPQYSYYDWNLYHGTGPHIRIRPLHSDEGGLLMMWQF